MAHNYGLGDLPIISLSLCADTWTPNPHNWPWTQISQRSANLWSGEDFLFLGCSNLANQKDSTISRSSHTSEPQALQCKPYLEMHFNQTTKHTRVTLPPPWTAQKTGCSTEGGCSAWQCIRKVYRSQVGKGFSLLPSFTFSITLDFNSWEKRIWDITKQLVSSFVSRLCFTLKSASFSQEQTGVETPLRHPLWPTCTYLILSKNSGKVSLHKKRSTFFTTTWQKKSFLTRALGEKDQRPRCMLRHQKLMHFGASPQM